MAPSGPLPRPCRHHPKWLPDAGVAVFIDKDAKDARDKRIFDLWLACHTQEEIAEAAGVDQAEVSRASKDFMQIDNLADSHKVAASHLIDFDPPLYIYNIWKQQEQTPGSRHVGNSEVANAGR